jgi:hypothetical protein
LTPAVKIVLDFRASGGQYGRLPHKQWTGWETSTLGDFHTWCGYHG